MEPPVKYYVGVDVGTSSTRAALIDQTGRIHKVATHSIHICEPQAGFYQQSSSDIWEACCKSIHSVVAGIEKEAVRGIGFDATCSLVVLDGEFRPLSVSPQEVVSEAPESNSTWDVIMWMDHRAEEQAQHINATQHSVLQHVGGTVSLEMQTPKLLWLKENKPEIWEKAEHFMDLPDFLTWRATGSLSRSLCSVVCKWTYIAGPDKCDGWSEQFFQQIGLADLLDNNASKIGSEVLSPGSPCGEGLSEEAAGDLHLLPHTPVATSIIDAHAGGVGSLGCQAYWQQEISGTTVSSTDLELSSRLALICGTSTCHMAVSRDPLFVPGVWGPYYSAMIPGLWLNEGGQSATGKLIDHIIANHPAYVQVQKNAVDQDIHVHSLLDKILEDKAAEEKISVTELTRHFHIWPDYHGNRSPLADPTLKGMLCGLTLATGPDDLALQYLAALQAISYGTRHIIEALQGSGHHIRALYICGGLSKNPLFVQIQADAVGIPVILPDVSEPVLLGAAILGACASGDFPSIQEAMLAMGGDGKVIWPNVKVKTYHDKKYKVFLKMVEHQREYQTLMEEL